MLPKTFSLFTSTLLKELLKKVSEIPATLEFDAFGRIYEYFLGEFAMTEGQGGFCPTQTNGGAGLWHHQIGDGVQAVLFAWITQSHR